MDEKVLKALGDPKRYQLMEILAEEGCCVRALAYRCGLSEPAVSQHLKVLREANLIQGIKFGYYTHYRINREAMQSVIDEISALMNAQRKRCAGSVKGCSVARDVGCKNFEQKEGKESSC